MILILKKSTSLKYGVNQNQNIQNQTAIASINATKINQAL